MSSSTKEKAMKKTSTKKQAAKEPTPKSFFARAIDYFFKEKCPQCNEHSGVKKKKRLVEEYKDVRTKAQLDTATDSQGKVVTTSRNVQVVCNIKVYEQHYLCESCGNSWHLKEEVSVQL
jgi:transposase-like protein